MQEQHGKHGPDTALERVEIAAWDDIYASVPRAIAHRHGIESRRIGPMCLTAVRDVDVLAYNRVIGFGLDEEVDDDQLHEIVEWYRQVGVSRFFVQVSPQAPQESVHESLTAAGLRPYNRWLKLHRGVDAAPAAATDLAVQRVLGEAATDFARVFVEAFEWPRQLESWVASTVGRRGWFHYLAFDGERAVATAAAFVRGEDAWFDFASTLPEYRGRGAQSTLIARRIEDCAGLGCRRLVVETAEPTADHPAPSYRNITRLGFQSAYPRANYIFEF